VHGRSLEAEWWTPGEFASPADVPIVLLHEGLGSVAMWRAFPQALASQSSRRVMAYSRFGHGGSDRPATPHTVAFMHEEAGLVPAILDAAGIERAVLFGHSDGGSIALISAAQFPARITALVLEAPHVFVEDISIASIEEMRARYETGDLRPRLARYHADVDTAFRGWSDVWLDPAFRTWNLETCLPQIVCPMLLMQGEQDEYGTVGQIDAIARQAAGPTERLVLPNAGHSPHRDRPDDVLNAVAAFCRRYQSDALSPAIAISTRPRSARTRSDSSTV
jgi:pimeloyl-ACP methyl ester carboxylesterase